MVLEVGVETPLAVDSTQVIENAVFRFCDFFGFDGFPAQNPAQGSMTKFHRRY
jgi:hypothetical protein